MSSASSLSSSPAPEERGVRANRAVTRSRRRNVDYGVRNQLMTKLNTRELHGLDIYRWEDDDLSLRSAALQARLPYDRMTLRELQIFPEMARSQPSTALFLYLRNRTLVLWQLDPLIELTVESIQKEIPAPFNSDTELIKGVHDYLQRYGYINFGHFMQISQRQLDKQFRVVVIGAGAAGLAAARQLKFFGFDVVVLEARHRTCGRVMTLRKPNLPAADLGAMIIMGIVGNPLITLIQQTNCNVVRMNGKCPIHDHNGRLVETRKDEMIQKSFNRILDTIAYVVHAKGINEITENIQSKQQRTRKISLGDAFRLVLDQHELRVQTKRLKYWEKYVQLCNKLKSVKNRIKITRDAIDHCMKQLKETGISKLEEANAEMFSIKFDDSTPEEEFNKKFLRRCIRKCLQMAIKEYDEADQTRREIESVISDYAGMEPSHVFMNNVDKRILDFHLANLEYAIGAPLDKVALKDWDLDDPHGFAGSHMAVKEGLATIIEKLAIDLDIQLNSVVKQIKYNESGVSISYVNRLSENAMMPKVKTEDGSSQSPHQEIHTIDADAVLCTIPLGVLKETPFLSVHDAPRADHGGIHFTPSLPGWKREAISRLGFGALNKVVLYFDKVFWDTTKSSFGRLNYTPNPKENKSIFKPLNSASRGELFLFFTVGTQPVLIGLFAGEAASITAQVKEEIIIQKAMSALHRIFGNNTQQYIDAHVTCWQKDQYARGSYSYMTPNSTVDDYDILARPLYPDENEGALPRVFFAGEHTNREHPSTVHGAFLSGLREASRIADTFIGLLTLSGEQMLNANEDQQQEAMEWQVPNLPSQEMPSTSSAHQQGPPIYEQMPAKVKPKPQQKHHQKKPVHGQKSATSTSKAPPQKTAAPMKRKAHGDSDDDIEML